MSPHLTLTFSSLSLPNEKHLLFFPSGFPGQTNCLDTGGPTQVSSHTSVQCVRRNSPAVTTSQNTSKSTVFHETAGQFARQTDAPARITGITDHLAYRLRPWQGVSVNVWVCVQMFAPSSSQFEFVSGGTPCFLFQQSVIVLIYCTKVKQRGYHPVIS